MPDFVIYLILIFCGAVLVLLGVIVGGWLMFKGKSSLQNEGFIGSPKGEVFNIDIKDGEEFPGETQEEEHILSKTKNFLKTMSGGGF